MQRIKGERAAPRRLGGAFDAGAGIETWLSRLRRDELRLRVVGHSLIVAIALVLWATALPAIDLRQLTDLGLISVLPAPIFLALALLNVSFFVGLRRLPGHTALLLLHLLALIVMLYGLPIVIQDVPRSASTWKHVGVVDYIQRHGAVDPTLDAYFNWPGMFVLSAFATDLTGVSSPASLAMWAPLFFNLLYIGPLFLIFRGATRDLRLIWIALWAYFLTNWVGQDYFSPQALAYFWFLAILGILLGWFGNAQAVAVPHRVASRIPQRLRLLAARFAGPPAESEADARPGEVGNRVMLLLIAILLFAAIAGSHQLTPIAALLAVGALVLFRRSTARGLPLLMGAIIATWLIYVATAFLDGHFHWLLRSIGQLSTSVDSNLTSRVQGSDGHRLSMMLRLMMTGAVWLLALLGALRRLRHGYRDLSLGLLAIVPFLLLGLQSYGGEVLLRCYFFALPAACFFVAALLRPAPSPAIGWRSTIIAILLGVTLGTGLLASRYGNERMDYITADDLAATNYLYATAPPHSRLIAGSFSLPWKSQGYERYSWASLMDTEEFLGMTGDEDDVERVASLLATPDEVPTYLIITSSQDAYGELFGIWPDGALTRLEQRLRQSPRFTVLYENGDAVIFVLRDAGGLNAGGR